MALLACIPVEGCLTLAEVAACSLTEADNTYRLDNNVNVLFEDNGGNPILFIEESTKRVGIGTITPSFGLHIEGATPEMLFVQSSHIQSTNFVVSNTASGVRLDFFVNGSNNPGFFGIYCFSNDTTPFVIHDSDGFLWLRRDAQFVFSSDPTYADGGTPDTGIERVSAGKLGVTDGGTGVGSLLANEIEIDGALNHDGTTAGFYNTAPQTKQIVTGSRGGNAALASLLTALATIGLLTNSSTA